MKKLRIITISLVLALTLGSVPALAATPFTDVPADAEYAEAVTQLQRDHIVVGTGNDKFEPDRQATVEELILIIGRIKYNTDNTLQAINRGFDDGWLRTGLYDLRSPITYDWMYRTIFRAADLPCYPKDDQSWLIAGWSAAVKLGFLPETTHSSDLATRGDMAYAIWQIFYNKPVTSRTPMMERLDLNFGRGFPTDTAETICMYATILPDQLLNDFQNTHGSVWVDTKPMNDIPSAAGYYDADSDSIHLATPDSFLHEMGHFVQDHYRLHDKVKAAYAHERDMAVNLLGDYAGTNEDEFFAMFFAEYVRQGSWMSGTLKEKMPETASILQDLYETKWA